MSAPAIVGLFHPAAGRGAEHGIAITVMTTFKHVRGFSMHLQTWYQGVNTACNFFANIAHSIGSLLYQEQKLSHFFSLCHCSYSVQWRFLSLLAQKRIFAGYINFCTFCEAQARVRQGKARKGKERQVWRKVKGFKA